MQGTTSADPFTTTGVKRGESSLMDDSLVWGDSQVQWYLCKRWGTQMEWRIAGRLISDAVWHLRRHRVGMEMHPGQTAVMWFAFMPILPAKSFLPFFMLVITAYFQSLTLGPILWEPLLTYGLDESSLPWAHCASFWHRTHCITMSLRRLQHLFIF